MHLLFRVLKHVILFAKEIKFFPLCLFSTDSDSVSVFTQFSILAEQVLFCLSLTQTILYYAWGGIGCEKAGLDTKTIFFKDITPEFDYYSPVIIGNEDFMKANPEVTKKFLKATAKGYEYAVANPDKAADILCEEVPELDKELVKESQAWISPQYKAEVAQWGYIDQARWDAFYKWLSDNGLSDEIPAGYGFTNEYLPQ